MVAIKIQSPYHETLCYCSGLLISITNPQNIFMKITWILLALLSGAFLPIQAGLNSRLGKTVESPFHASLISFVVGAFTVILYCILTRQHVLWTGLKTAPAYLWLGGILGAFYVTVIILAFPQIGRA